MKASVSYHKYRDGAIYAHYFFHCHRFDAGTLTVSSSWEDGLYHYSVEIGELGIHDDIAEQYEILIDPLRIIEAVPIAWELYCHSLRVFAEKTAEQEPEFWVEPNYQIGGSTYTLEEFMQKNG